jgi:hypothetical protein
MKHEKCMQNFSRKPEGKRPFGRRTHRSENNIKMDHKETIWRLKSVNWIQVAQDGIQWRDFANTVMNLWF